MASPPPTPLRRDLRFDSMAEVLAEVETLGRGPVRASGNWTAAQIVLHLAESIDRSIDGFGARASIAVRLAARAGKAKFLREGLPPGLKVGESMRHLMPSPDVAWDEAVRRLRTAIDRAGREPMTAAHPYLGWLTTDEWRQLHCRHAELHLGFLERQ